MMNAAEIDAMGDDRLGVVLAAGAGRRFGGPKMLAAEGAWLRGAVAALRDGGCDAVAVCMGAGLELGKIAGWPTTQQMSGLCQKALKGVNSRPGASVPPVRSCYTYR